jgi:hypothetical protein
MNNRLIAIAAIAVAQLASASNLHTRAGASAANPALTLTKSQAIAAGMTGIALNFEKIDTNRDGIVTRDELRAYALANRRYAPMT